MGKVATVGLLDKVGFCVLSLNSELKAGNMDVFNLNTKPIEDDATCNNPMLEVDLSFQNFPKFIEEHERIIFENLASIFGGEISA